MATDGQRYMYSCTPATKNRWNLGLDLPDILFSSFSDSVETVVVPDGGGVSVMTSTFGVSETC